MTKQCNKCGLDKDVVDFHRDKTTKDGLVRRCKQCRKPPTGWRVRTRRQHLEQCKAYDAVSYAVERGKIIKPETCQGCGVKGRRLEAHHKDYTKRLDVLWLCSTCHKNIHKALL